MNCNGLQDHVSCCSPYFFLPGSALGPSLAGARDTVVKEKKQYCSLLLCKYYNIIYARYGLIASTVIIA